MAEIGAGLGSSYPAEIDTDTSKEVNSPSANKTLARAEVVNDLASCIINIETTLGTSPAGSKTDVKTFLQTEHNLDGTHDTTKVMMLSGAQTVTGQKTFNADINMGTGYKVDGIDIDVDLVTLSGNQTINQTKTFEDLRIKLGTGGDVLRGGGLLYVDTNAKSNTGIAGWETLMSYTLPANSLIHPSGTLEIESYVNFAGSGGRKEVGLFFGSKRLDAEIVSSNSEKYAIHNIITGSGSLFFTYNYVVSESGTSYYSTDSDSTQDLSQDITLAIKASGNTSNTITSQGLFIKGWNWR